jgi:hypothetical protein
MKKILSITLLLPFYCFGQQNLQTNINVDFTPQAQTPANTLHIIRFNSQDGTAKIKLPIFSIFGLANLNQETLKGFNAGGKASVAVRPYISTSQTNTKTSATAIAFYASFNKSASNNDSVVHPKLIFPELGSSSFIGTLQWEKYKINDAGKIHSSALFFEIAVKSIRSDSGIKNEKLFFDALNYTFGYKYGFNYSTPNPFEPGKRVNLGFYLSTFISAYNIPDEDRADYKKIMLTNATITGNPDNLSDVVVNLGLKTGFHFNGLDFFADLRHVLGDTKIPIRELRGFHANIGFTFNADILNFY